MVESDSNPRFPHSCKILRAQTDEHGIELTDEHGNRLPLVEVFSSKCGYRQNSRSTSKGLVVVADYMIALPKHSVELRVGDKVQMTDYVRTFTGTLVKSFVGNFGANIWFDESKA